jgi:uncharacterized protein (AIM24 family)
MKYEIHGTVFQSVEVHLTQGESVYTQVGGMAWQTGDIEMATNTKGGLSAGLFGGEGFVLQTKEG